MTNATLEECLTELANRSFYADYDHSGPMDPSEFFDNYKQIERYLPEATAALLEGKTVCFSYLIIDDYDDEDGDLAGWTLIAQIIN